MAEKMKKPINNQVMVKPFEDEMAQSPIASSDWEIVSVQTVVSERVVDERSLSPERSSFSILSSTKNDTSDASIAKNTQDDYPRDAAVSRKTSSSVTDFGLHWALLPRPRQPDFSEFSKQRENVEFVEPMCVELANHEPRHGDLTTAENRVDDDSIDFNDDRDDGTYGNLYSFVNFRFEEKRKKRPIDHK